MVTTKMLDCLLVLCSLREEWVTLLPANVQYKPIATWFPPNNPQKC